MDAGAVVAEESRFQRLLVEQERLTLTVRGVRGSAPTPGLATVRYGGHTPCLELAFSPRHRLILDCGSGLRTLHHELPEEPGDGYRFDVFLTHYHSDHVEGLRMFRPLYDARSRFVFHGFPWGEMDVRAALAGAMEPPWFPVRLLETASVKTFVDLVEGPSTVRDLRIVASCIHHANSTAGFRLERGDRAIAFLTDTEPGDERDELATRRLAGDAQVLIHDAQFTPEEYEQRRGWGHSTWQHAVALAQDAAVERLVLFHHDPEHGDDELDEILEHARREFPSTEMAREGMIFRL